VHAVRGVQRARPEARGLHSSTFQLNVSAFYSIGGALRGCLGSVLVVVGDYRGYLGCILCQKRLRLSLEVDECEPLPETLAERALLLAAKVLARYQGLTHVHFSAQPKPFRSHLPVSPCLKDWGKIMHPT